MLNKRDLHLGVCEEKGVVARVIVHLAFIIARTVTCAPRAPRDTATELQRTEQGSNIPHSSPLYTY